MERRKVGYDLGCYGSMSEVWRAWPGGGRTGEYLRIGTVVYHWDAAQGNWRSDVYPHVESYRLARLDGDLSVGNRLTVGGNQRVMQDALFKRDVRIEGTLVYSHLRGMDCGLHPTYEALVAAFPTPQKGNWALVGASADALSMYTCQSDGVWTMTAQHQNLSDVFSLSAYDNAVSVLDTIVSQGYIFQGVAFPGTVPVCPSSHKAFYLASTRGRYDHFGGIEVRGLTAILWEPIASPDDIQVPAVPVLSSNSNEEVAVVQQNVGSEEAVATGAWHAYLLLAGVFVYGENIANDSIGMNHLTPELRNYLNQLALDVTNVRQDMNNGLNDLEKKLRGVGTPANAFLYPTLRLGDYTTMSEVNTAIDEVFGDVNETKHQGHLRMTQNGMIIFVDQFALDYSQGRWAQIAIGMVAPSADGSQLVQAFDHPHIVWRTAGVDSNKWHEFDGSISLKTINGQSLFGQGNITIGEAAQIVIDKVLDESSDNAIANSAVAVAIRQLVEAVQQVMADRAVIAVDYWCADEDLPFTPLNPPTNGKTWWDTVNKVLYRYGHGVWNIVELTEDALYLRKSDRSGWAWNGSDMEPVGGNSNSFNAFHRCGLLPQTRTVLPDGQLYIGNNTLYVSSSGSYVETNGDPNALYYLVDTNQFYVVNGNTASPNLKLYHDQITPIFEIITYDENNTCSEDMSLPYGCYVYKKTEGQLLQQLYEHSTGLWTALNIPKAYLIYNNEVLLYENNVVAGTGIKFKESFIRVSRWAQAIATGTAYGQYGYNTQLKKLYRWDGNQWYEVPLSTSLLYLDTVHDKLYRWNGSDMVEVGGGDNVVICQPSPSTASNGDYIVDAQNLKLYKKENGTVSECNGDTSKIYRVSPSSSTTYMYVCTSGSNLQMIGGGTITIDNSVDEGSTNPVSGGAVFDAIADINREDYRKNMDEEDEQLYPEYWFDVIEQETKDANPSYQKRSIVYSENYYDWNLVKYNNDIGEGTVEVENIQDEEDPDEDNQTEVVYPTEELYNSTTWYSNNIPAIGLDTRHVYYHTEINRFVLEVNGTYYKKWKNSNLWQDANGKLRKDTIYSRITQGVSDGYVSGFSGNSKYELHKVVAWIIKNNVRTDIFNTFTDMAPAINRALVENKGKCRLHSTRIYGCASNISISGSTSNSLDFNGQNGIVCRLPQNTLKEQVNAGNSTLAAWVFIGSILSVSSVDDILIENVKLFSVDLGVRNTSSNLNFSYSNSNLFGIGVSHGNDVRIKNVEFKNCGKDMDFQNGVVSKVVIEDWKSNGTEGMFYGGIRTLIIDRADLVQDKYSSNHILYCGWVEQADNHIIKNSRFIQNSEFNSNFVQYKTGTPSSPDTYTSGGTDYIVANLKFYNCHMRVGRGMLFHSPFNDFHVVIDNCTILQHDRFISKTIGSGASAYTADTVAFWGATNVENMMQGTYGIVHFTTTANLKIKDTTFKVWNRPVYMGAPSDNYKNSLATPEYFNVEFENVKVFLNDPAGYYNGQHATKQSTKVATIYFSKSQSLNKGKTVISVVNSSSNYSYSDAPFPADNVISAPKEKGEDFTNRPLGFSFFNTTLEKVLWLSEKILTRNVWVDSAGDEYSDINNAVASSATTPSVSGESNLGYVYDNSSLTKRLVLYNVDNSTNVWVDSAGNAYYDDLTSVIVKYASTGLNDLQIDDYFINLSSNKAYLVVARVELNVNDTATVFLALKNGNSYYNKNYDSINKGTTGNSGGAGTAPSGTGAKTPSIGAAYFHTTLNKALFYAGVENSTKVWVDSAGNKYDYYGSPIGG